MGPTAKNEGREEVDRLSKLVDFDRPEASIPVLRRLAELRPRSAQVYSGLALVLLMVRDLESAEAAARRSLELRENQTGLSVLGQILVGRREHEEGERLLGRLLEIDPDHDDALAGMAWSLARRSEHCEAVRLWRRLIGLAPKDAYARRELGWSLLLLGDHHEALVALHESLEFEDTRQTHSQLGLVYDAMGMDEQARAEARAARSLVPAHAGESEDLALLYDHLGMEDEARAEREWAAELFGPPEES